MEWHFVSWPISRDHFCRGRFQKGIFQHRQQIVLLQRAVNRLEWTNAFEFEQLLNLQIRRVHQHVDQFSILRSHLVWIHDLETTSNFEDILQIYVTSCTSCFAEDLKEGGIVTKVTTLYQLLSSFVVLRHDQS